MFIIRVNWMLRWLESTSTGALPQQKTGRPPAQMSRVPAFFAV